MRTVTSPGGLAARAPAAAHGQRGVAAFTGEDGLTGEDVLVNADLAMYDAKEAGRDQVSVARGDGMGEARMKGRVTWAERIRRALEEDRFVLLAQPIVDLATGEASQYELLLRMRDATGDLIPPGAFLAIAERLDLIHDIDRWVTTARDRPPGRVPRRRRRRHLRGQPVGPLDRRPGAAGADRAPARRDRRVAPAG